MLFFDYPSSYVNCVPVDLLMLHGYDFTYMEQGSCHADAIDNNFIDKLYMQEGGCSVYTTR